jgi:hypothetical protein
MRVRAPYWIAVWLFALGTRLTAAFLLPNAEQDGYSYAEIIARFSAQLSSGHFRLTDLFGFWLPLFQITAAVPNVWIGNALIAGKVLSAICGAISCVLVFAIAHRMTRSLALGLLAFGLVVLNPLHLLYSAACMTDVPSACLVLASLWFVLKERWTLAATFAALAGCVRLEAWVLIFVLPMIQFVSDKRISITAVIILILPPLAWLSLSYFATGDLFTYFAARDRYHASYLDFYPTRHGFAWPDIRQDADYFLLGANRIVVLAIIAAVTLSILRIVRRYRSMSLLWLAPTVYAAAFSGFLLLAYITKRQPVLLPRYGLPIFLLGVPLFVWLIGLSIKRWPHSRMLKTTIVIVVLFCLRETKGQIDTVSKVYGDFRAHEQVARALASAFDQSSDRAERCFSDDVAVRVLSHLPAERFVRSVFVPAAARQDAAVFESYLKENHVAYLVFTRIEDSLPAKLFAELGSSQPAASDKFQLVAFAPSPFAADVFLYRLRETEPPR